MGENSQEEVQESRIHATILEDFDNYISEEDDDYDPEKQDFYEIAAIKSHSRDWVETFTRYDTTYVCCYMIYLIKSHRRPNHGRLNVFNCFL